MAMRSELKEQEREKQPWIHLRATPEEISQLVADTPPFDFDAWMAGGGQDDWTPADDAELDQWLSERESTRQRSIRRAEEKLAELGG
jgi:hypothetical protein